MSQRERRSGRDRRYGDRRTGVDRRRNESPEAAADQQLDSLLKTTEELLSQHQRRQKK